MNMTRLINAFDINYICVRIHLSVRAYLFVFLVRSVFDISFRSFHFLSSINEFHGTSLARNCVFELVPPFMRLITKAAREKESEGEKVRENEGELGKLRRIRFQRIPRGSFFER